MRTRASSFAALMLALVILALPGGGLALASSNAQQTDAFALEALGETVAEACCEEPQKTESRSSVAPCMGDCPMLPGDLSSLSFGAQPGERAWQEALAHAACAKQRLRPPRA